MSKNIKQLEDFLNDENNFIISLRCLQGLDRNSLYEFKQILHDLKDQYDEKTLIEKKIPYLLLKVVPTLLSDMMLYSEVERQSMGPVIAELEEAITSIFIN